MTKRTDGYDLRPWEPLWYATLLLMAATIVLGGLSLFLTVLYFMPLWLPLLLLGLALRWLLRRLHGNGWLGQVK